jgi:tripartite-type tricarboxylate transporter receptor subunit TctC
MKTSRFLCVGFCGVTLALAASVSGGAFAAGFPDHPIKLVVPFPAGGTPDILGRVLSEAVGKNLDQSVIVENRSGAAGNIGAQYVARSKPDGYTLLVCSFSCNVAQWIYKPSPFDPLKDLDSVIMLGTVPSVLVVGPSVKFRSLAELVTFAKSHPGKLNSASSGVGSSPHLATALFNQTAGIQLTHVPYKGSAPAGADVLGGQVDMLFDNLPASLPNIRSGRLHALAVATTKRVAAIPEVPTFIESGYPTFSITPWFGVLAAANTPPEVIDRLNRAFNAALTQPALAERITQLGVDIVGGTPSKLVKFMSEDTMRWKDVVQKSGIHVEE